MKTVRIEFEATEEYVQRLQPFLKKVRHKDLVIRGRLWPLDTGGSELFMWGYFNYDFDHSSNTHDFYNPRIEVIDHDIP